MPITTASLSSRPLSGVSGQTRRKKLPAKARAQTMAASMERLASCDWAPGQKSSQGLLMPSSARAVAMMHSWVAASHRLQAARA